jgi:mono/diheme cytochrome c family protein
MKRFLLFILFVGSISMAETHNGDSSTPRPQPDDQAQLNKLMQLISNCSPTRPGNAGVGGAVPPTVAIPGQVQIAPSTIPPSADQFRFKDTNVTIPNGGNAANGAIIHQRCIACHKITPKAPILDDTPKAKQISEVVSGNMPKGGPLTEPEKADVIAYLNTLSK